MFIFILLRCVRIPLHRSTQDDPFLDSVVVDLDFSLKIFYAFWLLRLLLVCGQEIYFPGWIEVVCRFSSMWLLQLSYLFYIHFWFAYCLKLLNYCTLRSSVSKSHRYSNILLSILIDFSNTWEVFLCSFPNSSIRMVNIFYFDTHLFFLFSPQFPGKA